MKHNFFILFLLVYSSTIFADIYIQKDEQGNVIYSDTPLKNNAAIVAPPSTTTSKKSASENKTEEFATSLDQKVSIDRIAPYKKFVIISPKDQDTIQNQPIIPIQVSIDPVLRKGDKIQLFLDGTMWGAPNESTSLNINILERGTHKLFAAIIDQNQKVLQKTNEITIYVHRASTFNRP